MYLYRCLRYIVVMLLYRYVANVNQALVCYDSSCST